MTHKTQKGREKYDQVVSAARDLFYRRGFEKTSFSDIAEESGLNRGSFYFYFKSKQDILNAVVSQRAEQLEQALAEIDTGITEPRVRLRAYFELVGQDHEPARPYGCPIGSLAGETAKEDRACLPVAKSLVDLSVDWLTRQFEQAENISDARRTALDLFGRLQGASLLVAIYDDRAVFEAQMADIAHWTETLFAPRGALQ